MNNPIIGINAPRDLMPETLEEKIRQVMDFGYDCMELNIGEIPFIVGGEVCERYIAYARSIMEKYPLKYTAHIGGGLDLRDLPRYDLHKRVLRASIDVCHALGIDRLILHFEKASPVEREEQAFLDAHIEATAYAAEKNVMLCMENIEVEDYRRVIEMVRRINHENFRMTLDIGHLNLSVRYFGGDFLQAVEECAPYVAHLHMSDNTGDFEKMRLIDFGRYKMMPMGYRIAYGSGDIHLPPLWGRLQTKEALQILIRNGYDGVFLCEYENELYVPFGKQIVQEVRDLVCTLQRE